MTPPKPHLKPIPLPHFAPPILLLLPSPGLSEGAVLVLVVLVGPKRRTIMRRKRGQRGQGGKGGQEGQGGKGEHGQVPQKDSKPIYAAGHNDSVYCNNNYIFE